VNKPYKPPKVKKPVQAGGPIDKVELKFEFGKGWPPPEAVDFMAKVSTQEIDSLDPMHPAPPDVEASTIDDWMKWAESVGVVMPDRPLSENEITALVMAAETDSLPGSPWVLGKKNMSAQMCVALQLAAVGFKEGKINVLLAGVTAVLFQEAITEFSSVADRYPGLMKGPKGASIADIWFFRARVDNNFANLVIPVCRVSRFCGMPILGHGQKSVRRALATFGPFCPCGRSFHATARGEDGRDHPGSSYAPYASDVSPFD
jgi:hypothetical protein